MILYRYLTIQSLHVYPFSISVPAQLTPFIISIHHQTSMMQQAYCLNNFTLLSFSWSKKLPGEPTFAHLLSYLGLLPSPQHPTPPLAPTFPTPLDLFLQSFGSAPKRRCPICPHASNLSTGTGTIFWAMTNCIRPENGLRSDCQVGASTQYTFSVSSCTYLLDQDPDTKGSSRFSMQIWSGHMMAKKMKNYHMHFPTTPLPLSLSACLLQCKACRKDHGTIINVSYFYSKQALFIPNRGLNFSRLSTEKHTLHYRASSGPKYLTLIL